jgi:hypothetical protein
MGEVCSVRISLFYGDLYRIGNGGRQPAVLEIGHVWVGRPPYVLR